MFVFREELRGISRGKDAKDVDWQVIAGPDETEEDDEEEEVVEKAKPVKISVSEVLKRAGKPHLKKIHNSKRINKKGETFYLNAYHFDTNFHPTSPSVYPHNGG